MHGRRNAKRGRRIRHRWCGGQRARRRGLRSCRSGTPGETTVSHYHQGRAAQPCPAP
ncbi:hypothetical protein PATSB16_03060 [Pandoraea thiooxydans]|nr:hypothetical protein PATSB16_03060 [Pandoraea thiooxydans]